MINLLKKETLIKAGSLLLFVLVLKYFIGFVLAVLISVSAATLSNGLSAKLARSSSAKKIISVMLVLLIFAAVILVMSVAAREIYAHAADFCSELISNTEKLSALIGTISSVPSRIAEKLTGTGESPLFEIITSALKNAAAGFVGKVPSWLASVASAVPRILFYSAVTVLMSVYLCADEGKTLERFTRSDIAQNVKRVVPSAVGAYGVLFFMTFAELFLGLSIIGVKYSFALAFLISLVDALPLLGVGAVLAPWASVEMFSGNTARAAVLVIIWVIVAVSRQIFEPKLIGDGLGISPLLSIASMCIGFCLFGALGAVAAPFVAVIAKLAFKENPDETPA